ncbi:DUF1840 domain-containing protein [Rubrivivax sp. RP6-9]|uniref:DUF1840 domain-containing protein n=1 Tax=Rubrivivax sp. RP6-9 TaxID=3415750 RepID=UPI003CC5366F
MTYLFQSRATGDVTLLQPDGDALLRLIGREPAARGILEPPALPAALEAIARAVAEEERRTAGDTPGARGGLPDDLAEAAETPVTLRQRTWPLVQMLRSAHAATTPVVWGV